MGVEMRYRKRKSNELYAYCTVEQWYRFQDALASVKREWKRRQRAMEMDVTDWIYNQSF